MIRRINIDRGFKDIKTIEKLYIDSFPEDERIPFKILLDIFLNARSWTSIMTRIS